MKTNKLTYLNTNNGIFKGGFSSLTSIQLNKLKGGSGGSGTILWKRTCGNGYGCS